MSLLSREWPLTSVFLQHLIFLESSIERLVQLAALAQVRRLEQLTVHPEGNPVVSLALWRSFVIYRLQHSNLQRINGQEVSSSREGHKCGKADPPRVTAGDHERRDRCRARLRDAWTHSRH